MGNSFDVVPKQLVMGTVKIARNGDGILNCKINNEKLTYFVLYERVIDECNLSGWGQFRFSVYYSPIVFSIQDRSSADFQL